MVKLISTQRPNQIDGKRNKFKIHITELILFSVQAFYMENYELQLIHDTIQKLHLWWIIDLNMKAKFTNLLEKKEPLPHSITVKYFKNIVFKVTDRHKSVTNIDIQWKELETFYFWRNEYYERNWRHFTSEGMDIMTQTALFIPFWYLCFWYFHTYFMLNRK